MSVTEEIVDYLVRNRVSTTEVADVLGKTGALEGIMPVNKGQYRAGIIKWVYAYGESNWSVHEQLQDIKDDCIIFVDAIGCDKRAIFGELVSKYILLYHQSRAIVVNGKMRDAARLIKENWPIWCSSFTPVGCFNKKPDTEVDMDWMKECSAMYDGAIAVCDDCGVVVIPKDVIGNRLLEALQNIEDQEYIWFDRLDHYNENTFEVVCKKNYLNDESYLDYRRKVDLKQNCGGDCLSRKAETSCLYRHLFGKEAA